MSDRLSEIEGRLATATPGPWEVEEKFSLTSIRMQDPKARLGFRLVAQVPRRIVGENADADLIARAPADLAALATAVKAVRALHHPNRHETSCQECLGNWPCPTSEVIDAALDAP